jgi:O2-independent ubiquinone biosynthesis accessory factor UbiT
MLPVESTPRGLRRLRTLIDRIDEASLLLLALRGQLALAAAREKRRHRLPLQDAEREHCVRRRLQQLGGALGVAPDSAAGLGRVLVGEARRRQGLDPDQGDVAAAAGMLTDDMSPMPSTPFPSDAGHGGARWLRLLPPPWRLAPLLRLVPETPQRRLLERALRRVLQRPLAEGELAFLQGRVLAVELVDVELRWVIGFDAGQLLVLPSQSEAEATVRGSLTDLLCLAGRLEDADTLFFQRRLLMTGDTELGLTARNLLDRLPWEDLPLGLRIALNRCARLACAAREAYREAHPVRTVPAPDACQETL